VLLHGSGGMDKDLIEKDEDASLDDTIELKGNALKVLDLIPPFGAEDNEDFDKWFKHASLAINLAKVKGGVVDLIIMSKLKGRAKNIANGISYKDGSLLDELKTYLTSTSESLKWETTLLNTQQNGGDVLEYANTIRMLSKKINNKASDQEIIVRVIRGLDSYYKEKVITSPATSFQTLFSNLSNIQALAPPIKDNNTMFIQRGRGRGRGYGGSNHSRGRNTRGSNHKSQRSHPSGRGYSPNCFYCGQKGHFMMYCPVRPQHINEVYSTSTNKEYTQNDEEIKDNLFMLMDSRWKA